MRSQIAPPSMLRGWRELYTAALLETDKNRIPTRIAHAEKAIMIRARELFAVGSDSIEEDQALDDALYALRALQNCLEFRPQRNHPALLIGSRQGPRTCVRSVSQRNGTLFKPYTSQSQTNRGTIAS